MKLRFSVLATIVFLSAACSDDVFAPARIEGIALLPDSAVLTSINDSLQLGAIGLDANGRAVSASIEWSTDDVNVASVNATGVVVARGPGTAHITARLAGQSARATVVVQQRAVHIHGGGPRALFRAGDSLRVTFQPQDARGNAVPGVRFSWEVSHPASMSVDSTGLVRINDVGLYWARASVGGASATHYFSVGAHFDTVSAGGRTTCALTDTQDVYCWGEGFTIPDPELLFRDRLANPTHIRSSSGNLQATAISAGDAHGCAIAVSGGAYCWGEASYTGTGTGGDTARYVGDFIAIDAGDKYTCALNSGGQAFCWGESQTPQAVSTALRFSAVSAGTSHACALTAAGEAWCWGANESGQLGSGEIGSDRQQVPVRVAGVLRFTQISAGGRHTCGLTAAATAYCWGNNHYGQLGTGRLESDCVIDGILSYCLPQPAAVALADVLQISAGTEHSCAIAGVDAFCWGNGRNGRTGNGVLSFGATPIALPAYGWRNITAGGLHSCGFTKPMGGLTCWGSNALGQLPIGRIGQERHSPAGSQFHRN